MFDSGSSVGKNQGEENLFTSFSKTRGVQTPESQGKVRISNLLGLPNSLEPDLDRFLHTLKPSERMKRIWNVYDLYIYRTFVSGNEAWPTRWSLVPLPTECVRETQTDPAVLIDGGWCLPDRLQTHLACWRAGGAAATRGRRRRRSTAAQAGRHVTRVARSQRSDKDWLLSSKELVKAAASSVSSVLRNLMEKQLMFV